MRGIEPVPNATQPVRNTTRTYNQILPPEEKRNNVLIRQAKFDPPAAGKKAQMALLNQTHKPYHPKSIQMIAI